MNLGLFQVVGLVGTGLRCFGYSVVRMDCDCFIEDLVSYMR